MTSTSHVQRRSQALRRAGGQRGAALVEAAILTPVFFLMVFGIIEFGLAFHDKLTAANMSRAGARAATTVGNDLLADQQLVQAVNKAAGALRRSDIQYVVVYRAASPSARVPSGSCAAGIASDFDDCNVYRPVDFDDLASSFGCGPSALDRFWCPTGRKVASSVATGGPPDHIGIYVKVRHDNLTSLFGSGYDFTDDTVLRIEARQR